MTSSIGDQFKLARGKSSTWPPSAMFGVNFDGLSDSEICARARELVWGTMAELNIAVTLSTEQQVCLHELVEVATDDGLHCWQSFADLVAGPRPDAAAPTTVSSSTSSGGEQAQAAPRGLCVTPGFGKGPQCTPKAKRR